MTRSEKLEQLQTLWSRADNDIKERARNIYGCGRQWFLSIVKGTTSNGGDVSEDAIDSAINATKQAFKDQAADKAKFAKNL